MNNCLRNFILCFFAAMLCLSCKRETALPIIVGNLNEVLVVMDDAQWKGAPGRELRTFLMDTILWSTLSETRYNITHIPHESFESFRRHRNIVTVNIEPSLSRSMLSAVENRWAKPQFILSLAAPSADSLISAIDRFGDRMVALLDAKERERLTEVYARGNNVTAERYFEEEHQIDITIPRVYSLDVATPEFCWLSREERILSVGILFWSYPYTDTLQLTREALLAKRNEMTRLHVPGPIDSSYMAIEEDYIEPSMQSFMYKGHYCIRIYGWWKTVKAFMGGPFESIIMVDEERNRILTMDGFVYHPQEKKRDYLTQLDAIMLSMSPLPLKDSEKGK